MPLRVEVLLFLALELAAMMRARTCSTVAGSP
jgi:hypothetical protein